MLYIYTMKKSTIFRGKKQSKGEKGGFFQDKKVDNEKYYLKNIEMML